MAVCPICHAEFDSPLPGRLCDRCAAEVIARDTYRPGDLRFVGILAGWLCAAILSMPGAMAGYYLGRIYDRASTGCLVGVIAMSLVGLAVGFVIGPRICLRIEARRRSQP
jgi:hypothetical protein